MSRRSRYELIDPRSGELLERLTLYGDSDDDTRRALWTMLSESIAICGKAGVIVKHTMAEVPDEELTLCVEQRGRG